MNLIVSCDNRVSIGFGWRTDGASLVLGPTETRAVCMWKSTHTHREQMVKTCLGTHVQQESNGCERESTWNNAPRVQEKWYFGFSSERITERCLVFFYLYWSLFRKQLNKFVSKN